MTCPACGAAAPADARFCAACGRALRSFDDERRVVTGLLADLVGFTSLSERLDPEQVKNLVDRCFDRLAIDVTEFGGQVDKVIGDAIVALFGAPVAHEDDAERAVRAALRMHQTLCAEAESIGAELRLRVGVNTGEVLVGAMHAAGSVTAMGDVVNTASRLQSAAQPGEVLVGPATHIATTAAIAYEDLGLIAAKGREEPIQTWRALAPLLPPGYRARRHDTGLVGRDHEVGLLRHAVETSFNHGRASLVALLGDVGLGKSRLADEIAGWAAQDHGALVREGRCVPYGEANVWWPVADALRGGLGLAAGDDRDRSRIAVRQAVGSLFESAGAAEIERTSDGLLTLMGHDPSADAEPATVRQEAGRALGLYLSAITTRRPLVLQLSDLHFADDVVFDLIDDMFEQVHHCPVVVLATARPGLFDRWTPRSGRHNTFVVHVDPLGRQATGELLTALTGRVLPEHVADAMFERSGGNPFFLEELVNLLDADADDASVAPGRVAALPVTLRGLVAARLDDLSPAVRSLVQNASVIGQRGPMSGLREMAAHLHQAIDVDGAVAELVADELMALDGEVWSFRSDLVREVAYHTITKSDRAKRHAGIAAYLEESAGNGRQPVWLADQLAHHLSTAAALVEELGGVGRSGPFPPDLADRARKWVVEAASRARRDQALPTARRLYDQAIELLGPEPTDPREAITLRLARAEVAAESWDLATARSDLVVLTGIAEVIGDRQSVARALLVRGDVEQKEGNIPAAVATLAGAAEEFREMGDESGLAHALRQRGMAEIFGGDFAEAELSCTAALAGFEQSGDRLGQAWALQHLAWIGFVTGRPDEADAHVQASLAIFTDLADQRGLAWSRGLLAWIRFQQERVDEAMPLAEQVLEEARSRRDPWAIGMMVMLLASVRLWSGDTEEAVALAGEAFAKFERINDPHGQEQAGAGLGRAQVMSGRVEEGFSTLARAAELGRGGSAGDFGQLAHLVRVVVSVQVGEPARVADLLDGIDRALEVVQADELRVARAMLALQTGAVGAALALVADLESSPAPSTVAARALMAAASDQGDAVALAAQVHATRGATYADMAMANLAAALQLARRSSTGPSGPAAYEVEAVLSHLDAVGVVVSPTGDRVLQAVVALARARILHRLGLPAAADAAEAAHNLLGELGITASGWSTVFDLALAAVPA
jgi:class 3 adenylate cyclase/tetratricopeptide (TPR) repeat protein